MQWRVGPFRIDGDNACLWRGETRLHVPRCPACPQLASGTPGSSGRGRHGRKRVDVYDPVAGGVAGNGGAAHGAVWAEPTALRLVRSW